MPATDNKSAPATKIKIRGLYKIFGDNAPEMISHVRAGVNKAKLLETHNHVLGLQDINIDVPDKNITVIMGLSGSGKSTLVRHLNRLIEPTEGEVLIDGENILYFDEDALRKLRQERMSMVFQKFGLLPHHTVLQNTAMAPRIRNVAEEQYEVDALRWLERVGLSGFENHYPSQLSGGMQQRVGIARALTSNSDIMLMDEAFSALDPLIRTDMQNLLLELQKELDKTIIFITHDLDEALKLADHLVILNDGYVVQQGDPQDILLNPADPYVEDFIGDINRARVLRTRSVMKKGDPGKKLDGDISPEDTLESLIARSKGDTTHHYRVVQDGKTVGEIDMREAIKALVPRASSRRN